MLKLGFDVLVSRLALLQILLLGDAGKSLPTLEPCGLFLAPEADNSSLIMSFASISYGLTVTILC